MSYIILWKLRLTRDVFIHTDKKNNGIKKTAVPSGMNHIQTTSYHIASYIITFWPYNATKESFIPDITKTIFIPLDNTNA